MPGLQTTYTDALILGGGVLGTTLAYHLSSAGARATVVEKEPFVAAHASGKNAGMIRQLYRNSQLTEWCRRSICSWPDEARECFTQEGSVIVGRESPTHHPELFSSISVTLERESPAFSAVYCETDGLLDSPRYVETLKRLASNHGADFRFNTTILGATRHRDQWHVELCDHSWIRTPWLVNCAGAWLTQALGPNFSHLSLNSQPFARHLFVVSGWKEHFMPLQDIGISCGFFWDEEHSWYMRKWDAHTRLVSVCDRLPVSTPEEYIPNAESRDYLAETLLRRIPEQAAQLRVQNSWHCFRTYCPDLLPVWGPDPEQAGLFWLAAFGGFGMSTSYAAAQDAALVILNGENVQYEEFSPHRARQSLKNLALN